MRILQIAPTIAPGTGVGGVAYHLEREWADRGLQTARFTIDDAGGGWLPEPGPGLRGRLALLLRVVWFSTVGTLRARRVLARSPGTVSICHNDVLAGDVYVNHGILSAAMRARGHYLWRMLRNPLHLFTTARDALRFRGTVHRTVVNLTTTERDALRATHPRLRIPTEVIGNGVDLDRYTPSSDPERAAGRERLGIPESADHIVFVGHEFDRKGLPLLLEAASTLPDVHVSVVGGTPDMLDAIRSEAGRLGSAERVHLAGRVGDPRPWLRTADALALPSAYEANALVVLEALACGVPVLATPVGYAPDVIEHGTNGWLVERTVAGVHTGLCALAALDDDARASARRAARDTAERHGWGTVAQRYLDLLEGLG